VSTSWQEWPFFTHKTGLARMASHHGRVDRRRGAGRYSTVSPGCCAFFPAAPMNRTVCNGPGATCGPLPETTTALARSTSGDGRVGRHAVPHSPVDGEARAAARIGDVSEPRFPLRSRGPSPPACPTCPSRIETLVRRNRHVRLASQLRPCSCGSLLKATRLWLAEQRALAQLKISIADKRQDRSDC